MGYSITRRLPCSVCGADTLRRDGWFVVVENRWRDSLKILSWHPLRASRRGYKSACGRQHLKILIAHWLEEASLRFVSQADDPMPVTSNPARDEADTGFGDGGHLIGELSVFREAFSRVWTGSPTTLESIVDALIPIEDPKPVVAQLLQLPNGPSYGLPLH